MQLIVYPETYKHIFKIIKKAKTETPVTLADYLTGEMIKRQLNITPSPIKCEEVVIVDSEQTITSKKKLMNN